jgi:5-methylcytosine-specific restriction enzyme subunit McrC
LTQATKNNDLNIGVPRQKSKPFWNGITIRPDIVIEKGDETYIIDTKWKNISGNKPSTNDLRQMYLNNECWKSSKALLIRPSNTTTFTK